MKESETRLVERIIKRYGPVLDLRANPGVIIDILRQFEEVRSHLPNTGLPEPEQDAPDE